MLEKLRLSAWKKSSVSAENDTEKKDGPRTLDNNSPPVTKGVTFAVSVLLIYLFLKLLVALLFLITGPKLKSLN